MMPAFEDLTNMRFGKLLVVRRMPDYIQPSGQHRRIWHCVCDCGNECDVRAGDLKSGNTQSCGCYKEAARGQSTFKDLVGQTFGLWTVISRAENHVTPSGQKQRMWNCRCQCGTEKVIYGTVLMRGNTSCGCERRKAAIQRKQEREKQNHEGKEVSQGRREKTSLGIKTTSRLKHGINDLESQCPDLVPEWNLQRNAPLFPNQVSIGSGKKVWWICKQGHEWQAIISSRVHGNGCPYCSGQKILPGFNDLFTMNPELAAQWHPQKNQPLMPDQVSCGGNRKVWWLGPCGHEWQASIGNRANGTGCPYCNKGVLLKGFNDLKTINPALAEQWNYEKNQSMTPEQIYAYSGTNVWWLGLCGHEWQMSVGARTRGSGCPFCSSERLLIGFNDFATKFPHLAQEWHPTRNGVTKPSEIMTGTKHKYWWLCSQGHEYQKLPYNKVLSPQCPICNKGQHTSFPEQAIFYYVSQVFQDTVNSDQHIGMELDIFIPSIRTAVEYDGLHWHTNNNREKKKNTLCQQHGITLIRIRESGLAPYDDCKCLYRDPKTLVSLNSVICDLLSQLSPQFTIDVDCERDYAKILSLFQSDKEEHSIAKQHPELVAEWHPTKNGATTPSMVSDGVNSKVWWLCEKGHEYMCSPYNRKNGVGCPICCNKKIVQGVNDIRSTAPESLSEWDFEKNKTEGIYPEQCSTGSEKRVWWICAKCNYSYQMVIYHKFAGHGCPQCAKEHIRRAKFKKVINIDTKEIYESITHAEKATNISRHCISNCCKGKQNKAGGYHWAYIESDEQKGKNE